MSDEHIKGQILRGSPFGEALYKICSLYPQVMNVVEIGTWKGQGSTKCIMDALLMRRDQSCLWSLETKKEFYEEAKNNWDRQLVMYPVARFFEKLHILHGRIVEPEELVSVEEIKKHPRFNQHPWLEWRERNIEEYSECPNVFDKIPKPVDCLVLDGGQFSTRVEWARLKDRTNIVLCDDSTTFKTETVRRDLQQDGDWEIIIDDLNDRHGYLIACRKLYGELLNETLKR